MLIKRHIPVSYETVRLHEQTQRISKDPYAWRSSYLSIKWRPVLITIVTLLNYLAMIPCKCLKTIVRSLFSYHSIKRRHYSCKYGSLKYYFYCGISGMLSCAITHTLLVPLDVIKCRLQVKPQKYESLSHGFQVTIAEENAFGLTRGWAATLIGYSFQGFGKFGFYEIFKGFYSEILGEQNDHLYRTVVYLLASASAELLADVALVPWEAIKVRMQTQDGWAGTLTEGVPKFYAEEGVGSFTKGIVPLWCRQIPYTMMKFTCYERTIEILYAYVIRKPVEQRTKTEELLVTLTAGFIAGVFCAVVSHPADTIFSKLNNEKGLNLFDAVRRVGLAGLWKGLAPRILMVGTLSAVQLSVYKTANLLLGVPQTMSN